MNRRIRGPLPVRPKPRLRQEFLLLVLFIYPHITSQAQGVLTGFDGIQEKGRNADCRQTLSHQCLIWTEVM